MQYPIPSDWNGEDWKQYAICWPDSPIWLGYLHGFVTYFTRGRAWDGKTGNIKDAQAIGWEIAKNSLPLQEVALTCEQANELNNTLAMVFRAIMYHAAVVGGFEVLNLDDPIEGRENYYFGEVDFDTLGLANRIGPQTLSSGNTTIQATLAALKTSIDELKDALVASGGSGEDLEDDLAKVWGALDDITEVLGGAVSPAPEPL